MNWITIQTYIEQNAWVNQVFRIAVCIAFFYGLYRLLMSQKADFIRQKIPPLRILFNSREIKSLIKEGEYAKAGEKLLEMGEIEQAAEVFQEGKLYSRAGDIYAGRKNLQKAVVLYEKSGDLAKVGDIYLKTRAFDKLEELYQRNGKLAELGELYQTAKKHQRAAELFAKIGDHFKAAENFLVVGEEIKTAEMIEKYFYQVWKSESPDLSTVPSQKVASVALKAAMLYEKNKKWDQAIDLYKKIQNKQKIAQALSQKGDLESAATIAEESGDFRLASELLKKTNNSQESARMEGEHLFQEGELLNAIEKFKEAKDYARCADLYADLQEYKKAAEMHELAGQNYLAGKIFMDEKDYLRAGENYEKAKYFDDALVAYREGKFEHKILDLYDRTGQYFEMAEYFVSRKLPEQALAAAEKISSSDPKHRFALFIRGRVAYDRGDYERAQQFFQESLDETDKLNAKDLNTLHYFAMSEQYRNADEYKSLELLETKLAENKVEESAIEKATKIRQMIQDRSFSRVSQSRSTPISGSQASNSLPTSFGGERRYEIIKELGRGGMGVVYLAKDARLDREVALKVLPTSVKGNDRVVQTFIREAKSAAALNHPNIITVFDTGVQDGDYFISMEVIDGKTIKKILKKKGKFAYPVVMELLKQLLAALDYAHSKNVIHRDLTTSNIMWTKQKLIKIMDFGLAKVIHNLQSEQSIIGGTPSFMSPEQTLGKPADHRTDIYSLGICIFEMCLGSLPFSKGDLGYHHLHTQPPVPSEIDPTIPQAINDVILKC
ncbi:MAG: protein kinase, partial [Proteobacteria bacterium]|nr:protein kinase [Pseudomonadota bacterium]